MVLNETLLLDNHKFIFSYFDDNIDEIDISNFNYAYLISAKLFPVGYRDEAECKEIIDNYSNEIFKKFVEITNRFPLLYNRFNKENTFSRTTVLLNRDSWKNLRTHL